MLRFNLVILFLAFSSSLTLGQKKADEAFLQVLIKKENGEWDAAWDENEIVLENFPKYKPALWFPVEYMYYFSRHKDAIDYCDIFIDACKKKDIEEIQKALWFKGYSKEQLEDYNGALEDYKLGVSLGEHIGIESDIGSLYCTMGEFEKSREVLYRVIDKNMFHSDTWQELAYLYFKIEQPDSALFAIDKAINYSTDQADYYSDKADIYYLSKYDQTTEFDYEMLYNSARAITISNGESSSMEDLFNFVAQRNYNKALMIIGEEIDNSDLILWKEIRAELYDNHGKHLRSRNEYTRLLANPEAGNESYYTYCRGQQNSRLGFYKSALEDFETAAATYPDYAGTYGEIGNVHRLMGKYDIAINDFTTALELEPENDWYLYMRGWCKEYEGDNKGALSDYNEAIGIDSLYTFTYLNRGRLHKKAFNDTISANADFRKILEIDTSAESTNANKMYAYMHLGQTKKSLDLLDYILKNDKSADVHYDVCCLYSALGMKNKAIEQLEIALEEGWRGLTHAINDDDLDPIRNEPGYIEVVEKWQGIIADENRQEKLDRMDD